MKAIRLIIIAVITLVVGGSALHFLLTGWPFPKRIVDRLNNPRQVSEITAAGLVTSDGALVKLRHVSELPTNSVVVRAAVERGIEVDDRGRTFGLLRIWHWCGNDPVRYHLARVDLSDLVLASGGKPDSGIQQDTLDTLIQKDRELRYGEHGLNISDFCRIQHVSDMLEMGTEQEHIPNRDSVGAPSR